MPANPSPMRVQLRSAPTLNCEPDCAAWAQGEHVIACLPETATLVGGACVPADTRSDKALTLRRTRRLADQLERMIRRHASVPSIPGVTGDWFAASTRGCTARRRDASDVHLVRVHRALTRVAMFLTQARALVLSSTAGAPSWASARGRYCRESATG